MYPNRQSTFSLNFTLGNALDIFEKRLPLCLTCVEPLRLKRARPSAHACMHASCMHITCMHHACNSRCVPACMRACTQRAYIHANIHTHIHTYVRTYIHSCTYVHTYIHAYMHIYARTCMHAWLHAARMTPACMHAFNMHAGVYTWLKSCIPAQLYTMSYHMLLCYHIIIRIYIYIYICALGTWCCLYIICLYVFIYLCVRICIYASIAIYLFIYAPARASGLEIYM